MEQAGSEDGRGESERDRDVLEQWMTGCLHRVLPYRIMTDTSGGGFLQCFFVSDLHGRKARYEKLFEAIERERPEAVFIGGDLLPHGSFRGGGLGPGLTGPLEEYLVPRLEALRGGLGAAWPRIFVIHGNDDGRMEEETVIEAAGKGLWDYVHDRSVPWGEWTVFGYAYVPPTPFRLKDWERYDVSRFVDPGCVSPEEGFRTVPVPEREARYRTIREDLDELAAGTDMEKGLFLFHSPPYRTNLDRAALDGRMVDGVPLDVNVGSIAIKGFIALLDLSHGAGGILPHEHTLSEPKADRLRLMRATESNDDLIYTLYTDDRFAVDRALDEATQAYVPEVVARDDYGAVHRIWVITDAISVRKIQRLMVPEELFIADGHHRFETSVMFMNECRNRGWKPAAVESFDKRLVACFNSAGAGVTILPTHRLVHSLASLDSRRFLEESAQNFLVEEIGSPGEMWERMKSARHRRLFASEPARKLSGNPPRSQRRSRSAADAPTSSASNGSSSR